MAVTSPALRTWHEEDRGHDTPCWIWDGRLVDGYGKAGDDWAHRWVYEQHRGPIPTGLTLDHLCRVLSCVNPEHLEPVTHADNCRRGVNVKLTADDAVAMRTARASGETVTSIAARYGVSAPHAGRVINGRCWGQQKRTTRRPLVGGPYDGLSACFRTLTRWVDHTGRSWAKPGRGRVLYRREGEVAVFAAFGHCEGCAAVIIEAVDRCPLCGHERGAVDGGGNETDFEAERERHGL